MQPGSTRFNLMIAHAAGCPWAVGLAKSLSPSHVDLHWSRSDTEAIRLVATRGMHVAVVDEDLPGAGGLDLMRRIRGLDLILPCLLVAREPDPRLLRDALALDVFSVVRAESNPELLAPMVIELVRKVYHTDRHATGGMN